MAVKRHDFRNFTIEFYYPSVRMSRNCIGLFLKTNIVARKNPAEYGEAKGYALGVSVLGFGAAIEYKSLYNPKWK